MLGTHTGVHSQVRSREGDGWEEDRAALAPTRHTRHKSHHEEHVCACALVCAPGRTNCEATSNVHV